MYIQKNVANGYTPYLSAEKDADVGLDVGLLALEAGQSYRLWEPGKEVAALLLRGKVRFAWEGLEREAERPDEFRHQPWCLHLGRGTEAVITAVGPAEVYLQAAANPSPFPARLYGPGDVQVQHAGARGELMGCMRREIKTLFDYESAPYSHMVLGEVLNLPGKWSSYPPHYHPQPEVYFHRFDHPQGFGASFAGGEVYASRHNGLTVIRHGFHSQAAAPGYAMCYVWGIRHLPGNPWQKTRIDEPEHAWLWKADANEHIFTLEEE
ncbi:MAG: 5-deoxy-glucuronate isomerase [Candidatus Limiplasma sp.]|nr:5-deoxy-glucuronate isomerase [Candidatus Limiplasma sp.]